MRMYSIDPNGKKKVESLLDNLENKMIKPQSDDTITKLNKMRDQKNLSPADKKKIAELDQGQLFAKDLTTEMEKLIQFRTINERILVESLQLVKINLVKIH